jgi:uncharacterized protein YjbI with pentapeptide repeats
LQHWVDREFTGTDFRDEDLSRLRTERVVFSDCDFSGVNLAESHHSGSAFRNCTFERTLLWHWGHLPLAGDTFAQCSMLGSVFVDCRMRPVTFDEVNFTLAVLGGNDLRGLDLGGCRLREASLVEADLRKAVLRGADLSGARTTGARMDDADLRAPPRTRRCGAPRRWRARGSTSRRPWRSHWRTGWYSRAASRRGGTSA